MLEQLTIRDLVLLKGSGLLPAEGLTVISGETGGGKSLVVTALRLLQGMRGKADLVRKGASAATIDGVFRLAEGERSRMVRELYEEVLGTQPEEDRILVTRVLDAKGRSKARIDGRPITQKDLQRFGALLLEIHGQGQNRSLVRPEIQTELLDAFAGTSGDREAFARQLIEARGLAQGLRDLQTNEHERLERLEFLRYCLGQIERVSPREGEVEELDQEGRILQNLDLLRRTLSQGLVELYEGSEGSDLRPAVETVTALARDIEALSDMDSRLSEAARLLDESRVLLEESVHELRAGLDRLELDPARLETVEARRSELQTLLDRFGPGEAALLETWARMQTELVSLEEGSRAPQALQEELDVVLADLVKRGEALSRKRRKAARKLSRTLVDELAGLGMDKARAELRILEHEGKEVLDRATALGLSEAEVYLAPNPGEDLTPLRDTASGGEVARVMLVLKKILADADCVPVLVFDEADAEIGGRLGLAVGRKLRAVAQNHQVLCITHLPQIAAFADLHCLVEKKVVEDESGERTISELRVLADSDRRLELASMSRGESALDDSALQEADRLLELAAPTPD